MSNPTRVEVAIGYGYVWHNGVILSKSETDSYNQYSSDINSSSYLETKELLRDNRHKFLVSRF